MVRHIVLIFTLVSLTSARPGHSSAGTHFVIPFPAHYESGNNSVHITTREDQVKVVIQPPNMSPEEHIIIKRNDRYFYRLNERHRLSGIKKGKVTYVKSSGPIQMFMNTAQANSPMVLVRDVFKLVPFQSCYRSYYVTTVKDQPFINVVTFDEGANIQVKFPKGLVKTFEEGCNGDANCKPGATVKITLEYYEVWQFTMGDGYDFHNVLITSDKPVYVISGNTRCHIVKSTDIETCISNMKATEAWGKTYVVPNNVLVEKRFRFHAKDFPLNLIVYEGTQTSKVEVQDAQFVHSLKSTSTLAFLGETPFGLYQLFQSMMSENLILNDDDASILNLIPIEQWMHGTNYVRPNIDYSVDIVVYILFTQMTKEDVVFSDARDENVIWLRQSTVSIDDTNYTSAELDINTVSTRIYSKKPGGRMMIYIRGTDLASGTPETSFNFPYDFYQGIIYDRKCVKTKIFAPDDGLDNDCDGLVDEETENGIDDDGDGHVDEDNVEPNRDGAWGKWSNLCDVNCNNAKQNVRTRNCTKHSGFGAPCEGEDIQCNENPCEPCSKEEGACFCGRCLTCSSFYECDECRPGFRSTKRCHTMCPRGWAGEGCTVPIPVEVKNFDDESGLPWWLVPLLISIVIIIAVTVVILLRRKPKKMSSLKVKKNIPEGDEEEERENTSEQGDYDDDKHKHSKGSSEKSHMLEKFDDQ